MTVAAILALMNEVALLEPVAFSLVQKLVAGVKGKTDAEILAADAGDWAGIIATGHAELAANPPTP